MGVIFDTQNYQWLTLSLPTEKNPPLPPFLIPLVDFLLEYSSNNFAFDKKLDLVKYLSERKR